MIPPNATPELAAEIAAEAQAAELTLSFAMNGDEPALAAVSRNEHWRVDTHSHIARTIKSLQSDCRPVDYVTVSAEASRLGLDIPTWKIRDVADVCHRLYIEDIQSQIEILDKATRRRKLAEAGPKLSKLAADGAPDTDIQDFLAGLTSDATLSPTPRLILADIENAAEPPRPIFKGGPYPGTLNELLAESGRGKTFVAMTYAVAVCTGEPLLGLSDIQAGPVLFLTYEDAPAVIRYRVGHISPGALQAIKDDLLFFVCDPPGPLFEADAKGRVAPTQVWNDFAKMVRDIEPVLVVVDPLSGAAAVADENSNAQIGPIAAALSNLAAQTGAAVLLVHHASKARAGEPSQHMARGASALACRCRWISTITTPQAAPGEGRYLELSNVKNSYARPAEPMLLRVQDDGTLAVVERPERDPMEVARFLYDYLVGNRDILATQASITQRKGDGLTLYTALATAHPWITGPAIRDAIRAGLRTGMLVEVELAGRDRRYRSYLQAGTLPGLQDDSDE